MIRRKLTLKRIDPWSVLKFGFVINLALMLVVLLGLFVVWVVVQRLGVIERACDSIGSLLLDLDDCGINGGPLFRTVVFTGLLGVVVQTGIMVFGAFLYNLIADLTGGLAFSFLDESGDLQLTTARRADASPAPYVGGDGAPARPPSPVGAGATRSPDASPPPRPPDDQPRAASPESSPPPRTPATTPPRRASDTESIFSSRDQR